MSDNARRAKMFNPFFQFTGANDAQIGSSHYKIQASTLQADKVAVELLKQTLYTHRAATPILTHALFMLAGPERRKARMLRDTIVNLIREHSHYIAHDRATDKSKASFQSL